MKVAEMEAKYKRVIPKPRKRMFVCKNCGITRRYYMKQNICPVCKELDSLIENLGKWE